MNIYSSRGTDMKLQTVLATVLIVATSLSTATAQTLLLPVSVSADGSFDNDIGLLSDSDFVVRGTPFNDPQNVVWFGTDTTFLFDFGSEVLVTSLLIACDDNDAYLIEYSSNGIDFANAFEFVASDGPQTGGIDILTTNPSFPFSPTDNRTPAFVGREFTAINARFLRVSSTAGDNAKSIGEFQAFTSPPVPVQTLLLPVSVSADGNFDNDIGLLSDSNFPVRGTPFNDPQNVVWSGTDTTFLFDFGSNVLVTSLSIASDNNDTYLIEYSSNGIDFALSLIHI